MFGSDGQIQVNREKFCFIRDGQTIAKFTTREDGGSLESKLAEVERQFLKDAKVRLYKVSDGHIGDFLECMKSRKKPITHEGIGARSAICCHLMNIAYRYNQTLKWDPANCTFRDGGGDLKWLKGERRNYKAKAWFQKLFGL
jgi:hypothetical protein